ncbi:ubiquitin-protein ligase-like protein E3 [Delitschia confertaspora ATCC 74209]|uniref:Ubiquitin-protein ligase-like protein E3 n=1 Tax=Delitschia confertaspora ATCC 74209 TaxID=1513339 RepID=A0A9P4JKW5_9PLEO|nr:ubiquitin-protein ligase-like protein E3 [Delitschia confertaspora ATCC 74209]
MEAAIRWSPHSTAQTPRFLIIDVAANRLRLCQIDSFNKNKVNYKQLCLRDKLPNFTAFDWSKKDEHIVGIGSASGEAVIVQVDAERPNADFIHSFPIKHQRKCNSIAFSSKNFIATGLDRVRNDFCLNIYDLNAQNYATSPEPYKKLASSEAISSIKFFTGQPDTLIAGVSRQCIRLYDLRDSGSVGVAQYPTRQVHNIAIDPLDENYFISAGTAGDPTVTVWDQRFVKQRTPGEATSSSPVLEFRPIVDNTQSTTIWSLRYSGTKKSSFGVLANTGEFKMVELAQHSHRLQPLESPPTGAQAGSSPHYTKISHTLKYPWYHDRLRGTEHTRVIACDFMAAGNPLDGQCALALYPNREVEVIKVPSPAPKITVTALDEIYSNREVIAKPSQGEGIIAEDLIDLQNRTLTEKHRIAPVKDSLTGRLDKLAIDAPQRSIPLQSDTESSGDMHEDLLNLGWPDVKVDLPDYLKSLQTQKRRCLEGYGLDCRKNRDILSNDPWLVDAWNLIERMDALAWGDGMIGAGLDLRYLGVSAIWNNKLTSYDNRLFDVDIKPSENLFIAAVKDVCSAKEFPPFTGIQTSYPEHRQLCLALCGWNLSEKGLMEKCMTLMDKGEYYKAIVLAVFKGYKDIALDLLKKSLQQKLLQNVGLGAVIACDSVNEEQRHMCAWMADMTDDPYLKALLAYFIAGDWKTVVDMPQLSLTDRIGVAFKYLDDERLTDFLRFTEAGATISGDISGLIFTGLTDHAIDLLSRYIAKYSDVQTAVLLLSRACPLYIPSDARFPLWREAYLNQMQIWRAFMARTHYVKEHGKCSLTREGKPLLKPTAPSLAVRCPNCQQNLALRRDAKSQKQYLVPSTHKHHHSRGGGGPPGAPPRPPTTPFQSPQLACPNCNTQMPRCGLCMLWLGSPDPGVKLGGSGGASTSKQAGANQILQNEDLEARLMVFCMSCTHGFHGHHARDWFGRHAMCPVPDCQCMCGLVR